MNPSERYSAEISGPRDSGEFTPAQLKALAAVLTAPNWEAAAQNAKVSVSTLRLWRAQPAFARVLRNLRRETLDAPMSDLRARLVPKALDTLAAIMDDQEAPATAKVSACRVVLESAMLAEQRDDRVTNTTEFDEFTREGLRSAPVLVGNRLRET